MHEGGTMEEGYENRIGFATAGVYLVTCSAANKRNRRC